MTSPLEFDPVRHAYKLDGKRAPGVTTILSGGVPKPALPHWYAKMAAEYVRKHFHELNPDAPDFVQTVAKAPEMDRDKAAARGTDIHTAGEQLATTGEVQVTAHAAEVQHYADWLEEWEIKPMLIERPVFKRDPRFCGTLDLIATSRFINGGRPFIADLKSSRSVYGDTALQLSAYAMADKYIAPDGKDKLMPFVDYALVVHIRPDGVDGHPLCTSREEIEEAYSWFLSAYTTYKNTNARKKRLRPALVKAPLDLYNTLKTGEAA